MSTVHDVVVINRENLPWLITHYKNKMPFDMLVIDESSSFKSHSSQRFKRLRKVAGQFRYVVELTATPAPDKLMGLWSQMYLLDFGITLGRTWTEFVKTYFNMSPQGFGMTLKPDAPAKMYKKIVDSDLVMQLSADDYLKMPTIIYDECKVDMDEKVYAKYKEILKSGVLVLDETKPATAAMTAAALLTKLLQYSNGAVYDQVDDPDDHSKPWTHVHDAKLDMLESLIDSIDEPVIVAYSFKHDLERIQKRIKGVSTIKDPGIVDKWNKGEVPVLVLHPASSGHGLNLQAGGSRIIWFGLSYNLEYWQQLNGRLYRQGQTKPVIITTLICRDTVESRVHEALKHKDELQSNLLNILRS